MFPDVAVFFVQILLVLFMCCGYFCVSVYFCHGMEFGWYCVFGDNFKIRICLRLTHIIRNSRNIRNNIWNNQT